MTTTLITGLDGFTGAYLAGRLAADGHEVHGIVRDAGLDHTDGYIRHACDLGDAAGLARIVAEIQPDHVVHLAAIAFVGHADIDEMYRTNIVGTRHLLSAVRDAGAAPRSVLIASSANVYGNSHEGFLSEDTPPAPANDYAVSKLAMEYLAKTFSNSLPITIARPFNYTGVGQSDSFLIPKIVSHVRRRAPEIELGNLEVARDFSDVRGVVDAYARLLANPDVIGGIYNVCSGKAMTLMDIIAKVKAISGHDFTVRVNPAFVRPNEVKVLCGSAARIEAAIGPLAMPPIDDTLAWMLNG